MITALDTNVLLDVAVPDIDFVEASISAIQAAALAGSIIVCDIVYAEICFEFSSKGDCDDFLDDNRINVVSMNREASFLASRAWQKYRRQGGPRTRILPDFFIGAHALTLSSKLVSRDSDFYRKYFPQLKVINPSTA
jgi:predicted nucleic acid-binding protein